MMTEQQVFLQIFDVTEMGVLECSIISGMTMMTMMMIMMMMDFIAKSLDSGAPRI